MDAEAAADVVERDLARVGVRSRRRRSTSMMSASPAFMCTSTVATPVTLISASSAWSSTRRGVRYDDDVRRRPDRGARSRAAVVDGGARRPPRPPRLVTGRRSPDKFPRSMWISTRSRSPCDHDICAFSGMSTPCTIGRWPTSRRSTTWSTCSTSSRSRSTSSAGAARTRSASGSSAARSPARRSSPPAARSSAATSHSLHAYFLRPGDPTIPILYEVDRIRDGRSFTTRRVVAIQHGKADLQPLGVVPRRRSRPRPPAARPRRSIPRRRRCPTFKERMAPLQGAARRVVHRGRDRSTCATSAIRGASPSRRGRSNEPAGVDPRRRPAARRPAAARLRRRLRVGHDAARLGAARPRRDRSRTTCMVASLDHAMWFHRPFRADEWLLYDQQSPSASGGRGPGRRPHLPRRRHTGRVRRAGGPRPTAQALTLSGSRSLRACCRARRVVRRRGRRRRSPLPRTSTIDRGRRTTTTERRASVDVGHRPRRPPRRGDTPAHRRRRRAGGDHDDAGRLARRRQAHAGRRAWRRRSPWPKRPTTTRSTSPSRAARVRPIARRPGRRDRSSTSPARSRPAASKACSAWRSRRRAA